jgi:hypothetical protein
VTDAHRRRLILLITARVRTAETVSTAMRLVEDLVRVSNFDALDKPKAADPVLLVREVIDTLVQLQGRIETEIGKVPS